MFLSSQSGHVTMYTWTRSGTGLGKGTSMFQRTIPGHRSSERLQGIPLPMLPVQELSRRWFACLRNQSQDFCSHAGYPREPSLPAISSANTNMVRKNRKTRFPSDSVAKCSFPACHQKNRHGQMVRRTPRVQAALGQVLPTSAPSSALRFASFLALL